MTKIWGWPAVEVRLAVSLLATIALVAATGQPVNVLVLYGLPLALYVRILRTNLASALTGCVLIGLMGWLPWARHRYQHADQSALIPVVQLPMMIAVVLLAAAGEELHYRRVRGRGL